MKNLKCLLPLAILSSVMFYNVSAVAAGSEFDYSKYVPDQGASGNEIPDYEAFNRCMKDSGYIMRKDDGTTECVHYAAAK